MALIAQQHLHGASKKKYIGYRPELVEEQVVRLASKRNAILVCDSRHGAGTTPELPYEMELTALI